MLSGPAFRTAAAISIRLLAANFAGAAVIFTYLTFLAPAGGTARTDDRVTISVVAFAAYWAVTLLAGCVVVYRIGRVVLRWLAEGGPADDRIQAEVLAQPLRQAMGTLGFWFGAMVVFTPLNAALGGSALDVVRTATTILLGGLTSFAMSFLLVERRMRPVVRLALGGGDAPVDAEACKQGVGILPRLLLAWLLGSAIPLLGVGLTQVGRTPEQRSDLVLPTWFLVVAGLGAGMIITVTSARSVSDPINRVRAALGHVRAGDVAVTVPVDDGSEVGQLQSGFNAMVHGLRERQLLRDLFGRYVGDAVAREALARGVGLRGEQLAASALFVDLVGSTRLAAERPADEVLAVLNALFDATVRVVTRHGGWVNKFDGDGALAVFGPPAGLEGHPAAALRAARDLRGELCGLAASYDGLDAGIGVSSGTVVAGNVGAEDRYEYTVLGDPVNEAARLTALAKERPSRVLASGRAVAAAGDEAARWRRAGAVTLRGRTEETETYEPVES